MSGGSYDYIYCRLKEECYSRMYDAEMDDMIRDLADVLHDLEWWQSADSSEDEYRATLTRFKAKWFKGNRKERLKCYIDDQIGIVRKQLYDLIGEPTEPKSEWQKDHEILKAYSDGANGVLDEIRAEIIDTLYVDSLIFGELIDFKNGKISADDVIEEFNRVTKIEVLSVIDKYKAESEE